MILRREKDKKTGCSTFGDELYGLRDGSNICNSLERLIPFSSALREDTVHIKYVRNQHIIVEKLIKEKNLYRVIRLDREATVEARKCSPFTCKLST